MLQPEILNKEPLSITEVKDILQTIQKRDEELTFRGGKTLEHVNDVPTIDSKKVSELKEKLISLDIPRLKDIHIIKLIDTFPEEVEQVRLILTGFNMTITKDNLKQIVDVLDEYRPMKK
jgi:DNA-directed RNA polymerase subunit F